MRDAVQWFYQVLIENQGAMPVQLVSRLWHMKDGQGNLDKICGPGVVGVMPVLSQGTSTSFQYVSAITMGTPTGIMGYAATVQGLAPPSCVSQRLLHLCRAAGLGRARPHH